MMFRMSVALSVLCFGAVHTAEALPLTNGGFESPLDNDFGTIGNWDGFGGGTDRFVGSTISGFPGTPMPASGSHNLALTIENGDGFAGVEQIVPAAPNLEATVEFLGKFSGTGYDPEEAIFELNFFGVNLLGERFRIEKNATNIATSLTSDYQSFSASFVAPPETVFAGVVFVVAGENLGGADRGTFFVDDVVLSQVPEPTGLLLGSIGVIATALRRRR